jgi:hypothetical protein
MQPNHFNFQPLISPMHPPSPLDPQEILYQGWVLKKRRKRMQGKRDRL